MAQPAEMHGAAAAATAQMWLPATGTRVLAVIDNDDHWHPAIDQLTAYATTHGLAGVVLVNLQPQPNEIRTRGIFREKVRALLIERGWEKLAAPLRSLQAAGIEPKTRVELADDAETIVRCAREEGCSSIVIAAPPLGPLRRAWVRTTGLAGSTASQLAELADVPVLVVHPEDRG